MGYSRDQDQKLKEIQFSISSLETIDYAIHDWVIKDLNISTSNKEGFARVPVIWLSAERVFQRKSAEKREIFDQDGAVDLPIITIERTGVSKDPTKKGTAWANIFPVNDEKGGSLTIARRINQEKTAAFANADSKRLRGQENFRNRKPNNKVVYETITIPQPTYVEVTYNVNLKSQYQQQMNQMVAPFISRTGNISQFAIKRDGHFYEVFIDGSFNQNNNSANMSEEERLYQTTVQLRVLGYLIGDEENQIGPKITIRENAVEVKIPREKVIFGDINEYLKKNGFFRE